MNTHTWRTHVVNVLLWKPHSSATQVPGNWHTWGTRIPGDPPKCLDKPTYLGNPHVWESTYLGNQHTLEPTNLGTIISGNQHTWEPSYLGTYILQPMEHILLVLHRTQYN